MRLSFFHFRSALSRSASLRHRVISTSIQSNKVKYAFVSSVVVLSMAITFPLLIHQPTWNSPESDISNQSPSTFTTDSDYASNLSQCIQEISKVLGNAEEQLDVDEESRRMRGKPWNSYHTIANIPSAIVLPNTTGEVSKVLAICYKYKIPVVPFGGGTSIEGQTLTPRAGISLDFSNMKQVLEFNQEDFDIRVQAGVGYIELNELLKTKGLWFPLDPGPGASVGGMCACRCSGSTALRYGSMRENVLNLTAVLPDGTIFKTGSRARKSSAGYDLTRLLIGSEGTLAVITEATLKLHPIPAHAAAVKACFPSVSAAATAAAQAMHCGIILGRAEMMDDTMVKVVNKSSPDMVAWPEKVTMLFEVTGASAASVQEQIILLREVLDRHNGSDEMILSDAKECKDLWMIRKQCLWSAMSQFPDCEAMTTDACVPLSRLAEIITSTRERINQSILPCPMLAHAGDGNFHVLIMFHPNNPAELLEAKKLAEFISETAISYQGTCTGEHGIGVGKKEFLKQEMGVGSMKVMEMIKKSIDPHNIMNPDKIIDADRIC